MKKIAPIIAGTTIIIATIAYSHYSKKHPKDSPGCFILSKPAIITKPGCYTMKRNINVSSSRNIAFLIESNNVRINLNSKTIYRNISKKNNIGFLLSKVNNVEIRDGTLKNFYNNIIATGSKEIKISNLNLNHIDNTGIILSDTKDSKILNNKITFNTKFPKNDPVDFYLVGINLVSSKNIDIEANRIASPKPFNPKNNPKLEQVGVLISSQNSNIKISDTRIDFLSLWQKSYGIWINNPNSNIKLNRGHITNAWYGVVAASISNSYLKNYNIKITNLANNKELHHQLASTISTKRNFLDTIGVLFHKQMPIQISNNNIIGYWRNKLIL